MCGRYSLSTDLDRLLPRLKGPLPEGLLQHYAPRSQVRPGEPVLLQRWEHGGPQAALALWGLVPGWVKDPLAPGPDGRRRSRPINARSESVTDKAFFRGAWRHRRALLPADGFFEWQQRTDPVSGRCWKQPWLFRRRDRSPFWLGGLWERWVGADGSELETAAILTTSPNELMARVHDRMPVVIPDGLEQAWLEPDDGPSLRLLLPLMQPWDPLEWEAVKLELPAQEVSSREATAQETVKQTTARKISARQSTHRDSKAHEASVRQADQREANHGEGTHQQMRQQQIADRASSPEPPRSVQLPLL